MSRRAIHDEITNAFAGAPFGFNAPDDGGRFSVCCPVVWDASSVRANRYAETAGGSCSAFGAPSSHGCKHAPGHAGRHVCPCGSRLAAGSGTPPKGDTT